MDEITITQKIAEDLQAFLQTVHYGSLNELILCFALGAILASLAAVYHKKFIGAMVRFLLRENADSPAHAKTLRDMEVEKNIFLRHALRPKGTLRRVITVIDAEAKPGQKKPDIADANLYIEPGKNRDRAIQTYSEKGNGGKAVLLTVVLAIVFAILCLILVPDIIQLMKNAKDVFF